MAGTFQCPKCKQGYTFKEGTAGTEVKCRSCGHAFRVPGDWPPQPASQPPLIPLLPEVPTDSGAALLGTSRSRRTKRRVLLIGAVLGAVAIGVALVLGLASVFRGGREAVAEAYPGVISPMDVRVKGPAAEKPVDPQAMAMLSAQQQVEHLVRRHGATSVVALVVEAVPADRVSTVHQKAIAVWGNVESFASQSSGRWICYLAPVADIDAYAGRLEMGETKVDAAKRVVIVRCDPSKLTAVAIPGRQAHAPLRRESKRPSREPLWHHTIRREIPPKAVLVTVLGVSPAAAGEVVAYVRSKNPGMTVSQETLLAGGPCTLLCSPVDDVKALAEKLDLGPVTESSQEQASLQVRLDLARLRQTLGPEAGARFDPGSVEWAVKELLTGDEPQRLAAAKRLQTAEPNESRKQVAVALASLLKQANGFARAEAARALVKWGTPESVPALIPLIQDENQFARAAAIEGLVKLKDERAVAPLCEALGRQREAVDALKRLGPVAEDAVLASLDPANIERFRAACLVLGDVGGRKSLEKLAPLSLRRGGRTAEQFQATNNATAAVERIRQRLRAPGQAMAGKDADRGSPEKAAGTKSPAPKPAADEIDVVAGAVANLQSKDAEEIKYACKLLAQQEPDPKRRKQVAAALASVLDNDDPWVRCASLDALALWCSTQVVPKVIERAKDKDWRVRGRAIGLLGKIETKEAIEAILDRFPEDTQLAVEALVSQGTDAEEALLRRIDAKPYIDNPRVYDVLAAIGTMKTYNKLKLIVDRQFRRAPTPEEGRQRIFAGVALGHLESRFKKARAPVDRSSGPKARGQDSREENTVVE